MLRMRKKLHQKRMNSWRKKKLKLRGEQNEKEVEIAGFGSVEEYFDVVDEERTVDEGVTTPAAQPVKQKEKSTGRGVDPSRSQPDYDQLHLQAEFDRAFKVNARFQELLQK
ncbi:hypothetical protein Dimus_033799, partial [Dionaea muscipula]